MTWRMWFLVTHSPLRPLVGSGRGSVRASAHQALLTLSGSIFRALRQAEPYSPREVRARLVDETSQADPRTAAVHAAAAEVGAWMRLLPGDAAREHRLGLAASRLPSVVFWYRQGLSSEEIGRRLTPFGCSCYGDRAINAACTLIAALLNSGWARAFTRTPNHGRRS
jgi:hypothetical protein